MAPAACPSPTPVVGGVRLLWPLGGPWPWASFRFPSKELSGELGWVWGLIWRWWTRCHVWHPVYDWGLCPFLGPFQFIPVHPGGAGSMDLLLLLPQQTPRLAWETGPPCADSTALFVYGDDLWSARSVNTRAGAGSSWPAASCEHHSRYTWEPRPSGPDG